MNTIQSAFVPAASCRGAGRGPQKTVMRSQNHRTQQEER